MLKHGIILVGLAAVLWAILNTTRKPATRKPSSTSLIIASAWLNLGAAGGGLVNGTEYARKACYLQALLHKPDHANAWYNLGEIGGGLAERY